MIGKRRRRHTVEEVRRPLQLALVRRLFAYTHPYRRTRNFLFALVCTRSLQMPIVGWLVARIVAGPIARHDVAGATSEVFGLAVFVVLTELVFAFRMRLALELGEGVVHDLRNEIFSHLLRMPLSFFGRMPLGRLISRITSDVDTVRLGIQDALFVGVVGIGTMLLSASLMLYYDPLLFLVVLALAPVLWLVLRHFHGRLLGAHTAMHESFSRLHSTLAQTIGGIRVIQGFGRQDGSREAFRTQVYDHSRYNLDVVQENAVFTPLLELNGQLFLALLLVLGGYQALTGRVGIEAVIQFFFLANLFFGPIPALATQYNQALAAMAGAERVFSLLDTPPEWQDAPQARALRDPTGRIELRGVSFGYDPEHAVVRDVSFVAQPGQTVAIVGATGSGKSTIVNLIAKFYLPTAGQILLDDLDLRDITTDSLHRCMGNVLQSNFLFSGTVLENVRLGRPSATEAEVIAAARALDVLDVLGALPRGLSTQVGERGGNLSLGQCQIVCFTRAMLADPRILLLDEATSAIDVVTETRLQKALSSLCKGRTSFVVAHRLSTIRHAQLILVMEKGRIVERGTFDELIEKGGVLAGLYRPKALAMLEPP